MESRLRFRLRERTERTAVDWTGLDLMLTFWSLVVRGEDWRYPELAAALQAAMYTMKQLGIINDSHSLTVNSHDTVQSMQAIHPSEQEAGPDRRRSGDLKTAILRKVSTPLEHYGEPSTCHPAPWHRRRHTSPQQGLRRAYQKCCNAGQCWTWAVQASTEVLLYAAGRAVPL